MYVNVKKEKKKSKEKEKKKKEKKKQPISPQNYLVNTHPLKKKATENVF